MPRVYKNNKLKASIAAVYIVSLKKYFTDFIPSLFNFTNQCKLTKRNSIRWPVSSFDLSLRTSFHKQLGQYRRIVLDSHRDLLNPWLFISYFITIQPRQRWISRRALPSGQKTQCCVCPVCVINTREITDKRRQSFIRIHTNSDQKILHFTAFCLVGIEEILLEAGNREACGIWKAEKITRVFFKERILAKVTSSISFIYIEWTMQAHLIFFNGFVDKDLP